MLATNCVIPPVCSLKTPFIYITNFYMLLTQPSPFVTFTSKHYYFHITNNKSERRLSKCPYSILLSDPHAYKLRRKLKKEWGKFIKTLWLKHTLMIDPHKKVLLVWSVMESSICVCLAFKWQVLIEFIISDGISCSY